MRLGVDAVLEKLRRETFGYFLREADPANGWVIENQRSGVLWRLMRECAPVATSLLRAGFTGGWLEHEVASESEKSMTSTHAILQPVAPKSRGQASVQASRRP